MAAELLSGRVLLAHPSLRDANFAGTVVLLHLHDPREGAMGVILNRPMGKLLGEVESRFRESPMARIPLHMGGPVGLDQLAVGGWRQVPEDGRLVLHHGMSEEEATRTVLDPTYTLRGFIGHAGWSAGQLESEIAANAWVVAPFTAFAGRHEGRELWKQWLTRVRPELRLLAESPEDPGFN